MSVVHVLWECPVYRFTFVGELDYLLGGSFEEFSREQALFWV